MFDLALFIACLLTAGTGVGVLVGAFVGGSNGYRMGYEAGVADEARRHVQHAQSGFRVIDGGAA